MEEGWKVCGKDETPLGMLMCAQKPEGTSLVMSSMVRVIPSGRLERKRGMVIFPMPMVNDEGWIGG